MLRMKRVLFLLGWLFILIQANSQSLPSKSDIVHSLKLVNDYWINGHTNPGNNQWARAAYFAGNMDFYKIYPEADYLNYANLWSSNNGWSLNGGIDTRHADNHCAGQTYIDLYQLDTLKQAFKISDITASISNMVLSSKSDDWWWIDALFMAMPVFTRLGILLEDEAYFEKMYELYSDTKIARNLYNADDGLWYRDESFAPPYSTPKGFDTYWSRGNGWVFAAHVRVLQLLPESQAHRAEYIETFQKMALALKDCQRNDGFWNVSLIDPDDYGGPETSGTSFFTYGLAWGINMGLLDSATYAPVVASAWSGLNTIAVHSDGFLGYVQNVGSNPSSSQPVTYESTADFGVGAFLLAGTEVLKLAAGEMPQPAKFHMDSVKVLNDKQIQVFFNRALDEASSTVASNYSIDNITIQNVTLAEDQKSTILNVSQLPLGRHELIVKEILSSDGHQVETGEVMEFDYYGSISVTASSYQEDSDNLPQRTLDGDLTTRWSAFGIGEWILFDLESVLSIASVEISFYKGNERQAIFSLALSTDGETFTEVFNGQSSGASLELENYDFEDQKARYVKITGSGNTDNLWNSITEVRINTVLTSTRDVVLNETLLNVYPNPFSAGTLTLQGKFKTNVKYQVSISDLKGRKVYDQCLHPSNNEILKIQKMNLSTGVYTLLIFGEKMKVAQILYVD